MSARSCHGAFRERAVLVPAGLAPAALLLAVRALLQAQGAVLITPVTLGVIVHS